jgi:hypothetical protein
MQLTNGRPSEPGGPTTQYLSHISDFEASKKMYHL